MEHGVGASKCSCDVFRVAYVASHVGHTGMFHYRKQHVENLDAVLLRMLQKELDNAPANKAAAAGDYNDRTGRRTRCRKYFKFDGWRGGSAAVAAPYVEDWDKRHDASDCSVGQSVHDARNVAQGRICHRRLKNCSSRRSPPPWSCVSRTHHPRSTRTHCLLTTR